MEATWESLEFDIKPPLGVSFLIFPRGYLMKSFLHEDALARQRVCEIRVFPLLSELPKAFEAHKWM